MADDYLPTHHLALFAGRMRRFELRLGELGALETLCAAGIGLIAKRLALHEFGYGDIRETVRLGLVGGGLGEAEAEALTRATVDRAPLAVHLPLASEILSALLNGVDDKKKAETTPNDSPATSPPSTAPAA